MLSAWDQEHGNNRHSHHYYSSWCIFLNTFSYYIIPTLEDTENSVAITRVRWGGSADSGRVATTLLDRAP